MTDESKQPLDEHIMAAIALAHVSMLTQAASGEFRMQPEDAATRQAWLIGFISTGTGLADESNREFARQINAILGTQSAPLSTQPDAA